MNNEAMNKKKVPRGFDKVFFEIEIKYVKVMQSWNSTFFIFSTLYSIFSLEIASWLNAGPETNDDKERHLWDVAKKTQSSKSCTRVLWVACSHKWALWPHR